MNWYSIEWRNIPLPKEVMETEAYLGGDRWRSDSQGGTMAERSIAISLKRIADMMEKSQKENS
jgi:hypothetical protein